MFELSDGRRDELVERVARPIVCKGWARAAVFLLEAHRPLAGLGAHALLAFRPLAEGLLRFDAEELAAFIRQPENITRLIGRIETLEEEQRSSRGR